MKRILLIMFCAVSLIASAQNYVDEGSVVYDSSSADTMRVWFDSYKNKPWALEVYYQTLDTTNVTLSVIVSNKTDGSYSYYPFPGITFPLAINPVADAYLDENGISHASRAFESESMTFKKFGLLLIKTGYRSGSVGYTLSQ